jgi:hypothetical protein
VRVRTADAVAVGLLVAAMLLVHRLGDVLDPPYWVDEAWVAVAAKAPLTDLPWVTASSPLGWTTLVWLLPAHAQVQRLVPWGFMLSAVLAAYAFGRLLRWPGAAWSYVAGATAAGAVLLLPAQQFRHDLKQYTADAAVAVTLLALLAWAEPAWTRRRAVLLGGAIVGGMLVSHTAAFVGAAVVFAVVVMRRRLDALVFAGATGAGMVLVYGLVDRVGQTGGLTSYWADYFPRVHDLLPYLGQRLTALEAALGMGWPVFVSAMVVGYAAVARAGRPTAAVALAALPVIAVVAGVAQRYPLLDQRTSHFLLVTGALAGALGLVGLATLVRRAWIGALVAAAVLSTYAMVNLDVIRNPPPPNQGEDPKAQVAYVAAHRRPDDVILVSLAGQLGFAYYWSADRPRFIHGGPLATGWRIDYPPEDRIVIAQGRTEAAVRSALDQALALHGRVWLVRSHIVAAEATAWTAALAGLAVTEEPVGAEPLTLLPNPAPAPPTK